MTTTTGPFRPAIAAIPASPGPTAASQIWRRPGGAKARVLHLNESPLPPSPAVIVAIDAAARGSNRYPEPVSASLASALAEQTGVPADCITFANGSEELLHASCMITLDPGDEAVMPVPSFQRYQMSTLLLGGRPVQVKTAAGGANDVDALAAAVTPRTRVLFCCNPNNPTGGMLSAAELARLVDAVPAHVLLVFDEAYFEFAKAAGAPDVFVPLKRRAAPWAVLRTFSKAYAIAGMRVGYALCDSPATAVQYRKVRQAFAVSELAYAAALAALKEPEYRDALIAGCQREIARLASGLITLGLNPLPTVTNFISADIGHPAAPVLAALADRGIIIANWRMPGYDTFIRITAGTAEDTDAVLAALKEVLRR
ncbi:MAG: aminotransferase class I/II-fold pyridoxal phosphate-dependent enzyme [Proteobacteria bacterium]|nr:aminotransferase class I/II-fold pyridoxal phosphate-dependent enzyme [Pseudomonadota bacterium]